MNLEDIRDDDLVFVDANILLYSFQAYSKQCHELIYRIDRKKVRGACSTVVVAEMCHRCMLLEARSKERLSTSNPVRALSQHPAFVMKLAEYANVVRDLLNSEITVEPVYSADLAVALELQKQHGLLTNDSTNLAVIKRLGIRGIATADASFDAIPGLTVYIPSDIVIS